MRLENDLGVDIRLKGVRDDVNRVIVLVGYIKLSACFEMGGDCDMFLSGQKRIYRPG